MITTKKFLPQHNKFPALADLSSLFKGSVRPGAYAHGFQVISKEQYCRDHGHLSLDFFFCNAGESRLFATTSHNFVPDGDDVSARQLQRGNNAGSMGPFRGLAWVGQFNCRFE